MNKKSILVSLFLLISLSHVFSYVIIDDFEDQDMGLNPNWNIDSDDSPSFNNTIKYSGNYSWGSSNNGIFNSAYSFDTNFEPYKGYSYYSFWFYSPNNFQTEDSVLKVYIYDTNQDFEEEYGIQYLWDGEQYIGYGLYIYTADAFYDFKEGEPITLDANKWYNFTIYRNMDMQKVSLYIYDSSGIEISSVTDVNMKLSTTLNIWDKFIINNSQYGLYFDNLVYSNSLDYLPNIDIISPTTGGYGGNIDLNIIIPPTDNDNCGVWFSFGAFSVDSCNWFWLLSLFIMAAILYNSTKKSRRRRR